MRNVRPKETYFFIDSRYMWNRICHVALMMRMAIIWILSRYSRATNRMKNQMTRIALTKVNFPDELSWATGWSHWKGQIWYFDALFQFMPSLLLASVSTLHLNVCVCHTLAMYVSIAFHFRHCLHFLWVISFTQRHGVHLLSKTSLDHCRLNAAFWRKIISCECIKIARNENNNNNNFEKVKWKI